MDSQLHSVLQQGEKMAAMQALSKPFVGQKIECRSARQTQRVRSTVVVRAAQEEQNLVRRMSIREKIQLIPAMCYLHFESPPRDLLRCVVELGLDCKDVFLHYFRDHQCQWHRRLAGAGSSRRAGWPHRSSCPAVLPEGCVSCLWRRCQGIQRA